MLRDLLTPSLCTRLEDCFHPLEIALLCAGLLASVSLVLAALCAFDERIDDVRHWSQRPWEPTVCAVLEAGIAYRGDCKNRSFGTLRTLHRSPSFNYSDCSASGSGRSCRAAASAVFGDGRRLEGRERREGLPRRRGGTVEVRLRSLLDNNKPEVLCLDRFLPWASVLVRGRHLCGYRMGLPHQSRVLDWHEALGSLAEHDAGMKLPCWLLTLDEPVGAPRPSLGVTKPGGAPATPAALGRWPLPCVVVALEDPRTWPGASRAWVQGQIGMKGAALYGALGCVVAAVVAVAMHHCWRSSSMPERGRWMPAVETPPAPPGAEMERRQRSVQDRWALFRTSVLAEYQPIGSARDVPGPAG